MDSTSPKHWKVHTSWDDLPVGNGNSGGTYQKFNIGVPGDEDAPTVIKATFPPNTTVEPHSHVSDYTEIILEGTEENTRRLMRAGDIAIVKAGTVYGPLISGDEGVTKLIIFRGKGSTVRPSESNAAMESTVVSESTGAPGL